MKKGEEGRRMDKKVRRRDKKGEEGRRREKKAEEGRRMEAPSLGPGRLTP